MPRTQSKLRARGSWTRREAALLAPEDREDPEKREAARTVIRRAVENNVLTADFPVEVETAPGHFETITVGRILDDRAGFHGRLTRDPLEPGYDGGRATGKLFLINSRPTLFSFAHHGRSFRLVRSPERIEVVQGRLAAATESALGILRNDPAVFDFGGQVVLVEDGRMLPLDEHALGYYLAGGVQFWQHRKAGGDFIAVDIDPPAKTRSTDPQPRAAAAAEVALRNRHRTDDPPGRLGPGRPGIRLPNLAAGRPSGRGCRCAVQHRDEARSRGR